MSEDVQRTLIKKIEELVNLNNSLKSLFKELIEIVAGKFEQIRTSLNQLKEQKIDFKELYDRILSIEEAVRNLPVKPAVTVKPEPAPVQEVKVSEAKVKPVEEPVSVAARISQATSSKGPVDDIFRYMASTLSADLSGEELAREFEASRDKLMEYHSFHPVYHEIARVINTLRKYKDSKLTKRDVEELAAQIERWRDRMVS
ncbi:MAG: hypothetical protein OdinLCB4_006665 [Candidatus Odinarchaeum yellowstonii]|uniref:Uncharacterized protein n=1 Tax=Odinarchaeota yellowstonii (strain LCB_4) TaxID=1841599 RepID=A0AAF0IAP2_ODILC|nr:MAG: hypothetical protein OdinLCB4_006665 [Candidatus Odinarchaeum yellowstonii]